ncbi:hypothetical protein HY440_00615 [Candidatus Microgenomates bacterium]|nr:hypothetical protein [Candidatus Microgenomates bacterium]
MAKTIALALAAVGLMTYFTPWGRTLNLMAVGAVVSGLVWKKLGEKLAIFVLCLLALQVLIAGFLEGGQIVHQLSTPLGASYTTDMRAFLKTYQLMKQGENFYPAFATGMAGLSNGVFHPDINGWRQPLIFYLWKILPGNGTSIYFLWEGMIILSLTAAFLVAKKFLPTRLAILSPLILWPYFHFSLVDLTLLQPEWWATSFFLFGLTAYLYQKFILAGILFATTLATRELFIFPIILLLIINRKPLVKLALPLTFFAIYYSLYHLPKIFTFGTELVRSSRHGGPYVLHYLLAYSSWSYWLGIFRPFLVVLGLVAVSLMRKRPLVLLISFLPLLLVAFSLAALGVIDETRDYWGIYFMPLLLVSTPALILPPEE